MRTTVLTESRPALLDLTQHEAEALARAGKRLASNKAWWGSAIADPGERTVLQCQPTASGKWSVCVRDAVGLVSVGQLQIIVQPKIALSHFLYLLSAAGHLPRLSDERGSVAPDASLWQLVATWFVDVADRVLRKDLLRDYEAAEDWLPAKRGQIVVLPTARAFLAGRYGFECRYEEFSVNTPLNRILKAAAMKVLGSIVLPSTLRRQARVICSRMTDIGDLHSSDLLTEIDRRSAYYADALQLARHVLSDQGRMPETGEATAWTFLIRTPEMVEDGLRAVLAARLSNLSSVEKRGIRVDAGLTFTPDLVFAGGRVVADIKYKVLGPDWMRSDLYQIIAFGTAFHATDAAILGFEHTALDKTPKALRVGGVQVRALCWNADPVLTAASSACEFGDRVATWLRECGQAASREPPGSQAA
jgi:5-methylcytosine-specific restriction enzyme subunit McrC